MVATELRGGSKPSLNEALGWIGSRVDDIYGANVGRLEDVWIDPGTGIPRWLLVKEGRFGGRTTLIPFEDATAGAGHVWVPYERDVVRDAPEIEAGAPLTQQVETALRSHYSANAPAAMSHGAASVGDLPPPGPQPGSAMGTATVRFRGPAEAGPSDAFAPLPPPEPPPPTARRPHTPPQRYVLREPYPPAPAAQGPGADAFERPGDQPAAPGYASGSSPAGPQQHYAAGQRQQQVSAPDQRYAEVRHEHSALGQRPPPGPPPAPDPAPAQGYRPPQPYVPPIAPAPPYPHQPPSPEVKVWPQRSVAPHQAPPPPPPPDPAQAPIAALRALAESGEAHYVEIELSGELTIRGQLRTVRVTPPTG